MRRTKIEPVPPSLWSCLSCRPPLSPSFMRKAERDLSALALTPTAPSPHACSAGSMQHAAMPCCVCLSPASTGKMPHAHVLFSFVFLSQGSLDICLHKAKEIMLFDEPSPFKNVRGRGMEGRSPGQLGKERGEGEAEYWIEPTTAGMGKRRMKVQGEKRASPFPSPRG